MNKTGSQTNKHICEIDIAKGIGIILVVLGHLETLSGATWKQFAASFHMPLFFFIYGVIGFMDEAPISDFFQFVKKRIGRILVPYFLWALIYSFNNISMKQIFMIFYANNKTFAEAGLWFLPTMFTAECLYYLIMAIKEQSGILSVYISGLVCACLSYFMNYVGNKTFLWKYGYPFSFDIALTAVIFILCGSIFREIYIHHIIPDYKRKSRIFLPVIIVLFATVYIISKININYITDFAFNRVVMARASYGIYPLFLIGGGVGSISVLIFSCYLKPLKKLEYIGQNSLLYMCTNHVCILVFMMIFEKFVSIDTLQPIIKFIWCMIALCFVMVMSTVISFIINRYVPILNGRWGKQK